MATAKATHYAILQIPETASAEIIERAYREQIGATHPDRADDEADRVRRTRAAMLVNEAGRVLRDADRRAVYDFDLAAMRRQELANRIITPRPEDREVSTSVSYPGPASSPMVDPVMSARDRETTPAAPRGSLRDLRERRRTMGVSNAALAFLRWNRIGQWLLVIALWLIVRRAQAVFWPDTATDMTPGIVVVGLWLIVGALWARSRTLHPLGHILRIIGFILAELFDSGRRQAEANARSSNQDA